MNKALNDSVMRATKQIISATAGCAVTSNDPVEKGIGEDSQYASVIISFFGSISGAFTLKCSRESARFFASQMLGMDVATDSDDMKDAMGEFLNMIVGAAKTNFSADKDVFTMSVPTTILGGDYTVYMKANKHNTCSAIDFNCGGKAMSIEVFIE